MVYHLRDKIKDFLVALFKSIPVLVGVWLVIAAFRHAAAAYKSSEWMSWVLAILCVAAAVIYIYDVWLSIKLREQMREMLRLRERMEDERREMARLTRELREEREKACAPLRTRSKPFVGN